MNETSRAELETQIGEYLARQDLRAAATLAIEGYGPEVLGYLHALDSTGTEAPEAFAMFCEALWRGLPKFRRDASLRTWAYVLARNAFFRLHRDPSRRHKVVPLSDCPEISGIADAVRTRTLVHLRTETKDQVARLREELEPAERDLLVLRIDRGLAWQDIARVVSPEPDPDEKQLKQEAARLRKRYERIKAKLRELVHAAGIGASHSPDRGSTVT